MERSGGLGRGWWLRRLPWGPERRSGPSVGPGRGSAARRGISALAMSLSACAISRRSQRAYVSSRSGAGTRNTEAMAWRMSAKATSVRSSVAAILRLSRKWVWRCAEDSTEAASRSDLPRKRLAARAISPSASVLSCIRPRMSCQFSGGRVRYSRTLPRVRRPSSSWQAANRIMAGEQGFGLLVPMRLADLSRRSPSPAPRPASPRPRRGRGCWE